MYIVKCIVTKNVALYLKIFYINIEIFITESYQNNMSPMSAMNEQYECAHSTGPYIPISECITGVRAQVF